MKFVAGTIARFLQFAFLVSKVWPTLEGVVHAAFSPRGAKFIVGAFQLSTPNLIAPEWHLFPITCD